MIASITGSNTITPSAETAFSYVVFLKRKLTINGVRKMVNRGDDITNSFIIRLSKRAKGEFEDVYNARAEFAKNNGGKKAYELILAAIDAGSIVDEEDVEDSISGEDLCSGDYERCEKCGLWHCQCNAKPFCKDCNRLDVEIHEETRLCDACLDKRVNPTNTSNIVEGPFK